uniref:DDE_Tnp_1_7 domain-containing protein n=1 Tax=Panagrellus redivivus TaxID=6233 RepID=A0A7E4UU98_PANRE
MAISLVPFLQLQEQINVFGDSAEEALNVAIEGKCFKMDARLVKAAALVQNPRHFGITIFQLVMDITTLINYSVGYLQTGRIAGPSKRQKGEPKKPLSMEFNRFFGNLCMLCGGCAVHEASLRIWFSEIRDGLNERGDNLFAGSAKKKPDLGYMRPGEDHRPAFDDPTVFMAPPTKKRRFVVVDEEVIDVDEDCSKTYYSTPTTWLSSPEPPKDKAGKPDVRKVLELVDFQRTVIRTALPCQTTEEFIFDLQVSTARMQQAGVDFNGIVKILHQNPADMTTSPSPEVYCM